VLPGGKVELLAEGFVVGLENCVSVATTFLVAAKLLTFRVNVVMGWGVCKKGPSGLFSPPSTNYQVLSSFLVAIT